MIRSNTCFIVGAGASTEVGLPAGAGLKANLRNTLDLRFLQNQLQRGSVPIFHALTTHCGRLQEKLSDYISACTRIAQGMDQAASIDNFIHAHADDKRIEFCGKIGIAESILRAESNSALALAEDDGRLGRYLTHKRIADTWYSVLFQALVEDVQRYSLDGLFANVTFVTFNYDRCIEHYLFHALADYYNINHRDATSILSRLRVYHAYGQLGNLSWQDSSASVDFGQEPDNPHVLLAASSRLRTFTEGMSDQDLLAGISEALNQAKNIVFLGFGFHRLNMEILSSIPAPNIIGTADGLSEYDIETVQGDFQQRHKRRIRLVQARCANFLSSYRRMFTS